MWWRALGVAVVLLAAGVAGGYAVADRTAEEPADSSTLEPVPGVSPAVPTPEVHPVLPDPAADPLEPDVPTHPVVLRLPHRGAGVIAQVPDGWRINPSGDTWTFAKEGNPTNTFGLRIQLLFGQRQSISVVKGARLAALEQAVEQGNMFELTVTDETEDAFQATYIDDDDYFRVTMERFRAFTSDMAYVVVAATGRDEDLEGVRDLVSRTADTLVELKDGVKAPKP